ncbi:hypothetical protein [Shewanella aegiceratis]|uniref:hypothetical protein n=1 Tax=Shewanella aegiceratis TaxID=2864203 RepID=UPI001C65A6C6|nr:hypothetical protein [Shewanella aegiceratis]QYJ81421.1 hypothetical protein K0H80_14015 [Shewanella aegiceratis]
MNMNERCSHFEDSEWVEVMLTSEEISELGNIERSISTQSVQVWFQNQDRKIGLCEYSVSSIDKDSSCGSSFTTFKKTDGKWELENEGLNICSGYPR